MYIQNNYIIRITKKLHFCSLPYKHTYVRTTKKLTSHVKLHRLLVFIDSHVNEALETIPMIVAHKIIHLGSSIN